MLFYTGVVKENVYAQFVFGFRPVLFYTGVVGQINQEAKKASVLPAFLFF